MYYIENINTEIQLRKTKNRKSDSHTFTGTCISYTTKEQQNPKDTARQHRLTVSVNDEEKARLEQLGIKPLQDGTFVFVRPAVRHPKGKNGSRYAYVEGLEGNEITFQIGINRKYPSIVHLSTVDLKPIAAPGRQE